MGMSPSEVATDPRVKELVEIWLKEPSAVLDQGAIPDMISDIGLDEKFIPTRVSNRILACAIMDRRDYIGQEARMWIRREAKQAVGGVVPITIYDGNILPAMRRVSEGFIPDVGHRTFPSAVKRDRDENGFLEPIIWRAICGTINLIVAFRTGFRLNAA